MESFVRRATAVAALLSLSTVAAAQVQFGPSAVNPEAVAPQHAELMERIVRAHERAAAAARAVLGMSADDMNPDELEAQLADRVPGFAGWVHRTDGTSVMRLVARGGNNTVAAARAALERSPAAKALADATQTKVDVRPALWDSRQLLDYKRKAFTSGASAGLISVHIDRDANRVEVQYNQELDAAGIEALMERFVAAGVPRTALVLKPGEPFTAFATVGTSVQRQPLPLAAGARFNFRITQGEFHCTVGLPVRRGSTLGFLTAAHCSQRPYSTAASTPMTSPAGQSIGRETFDPPPFNCALDDNLGCRNADVLFVSGGPANAYDFGRLLQTPSNSLNVSAVRQIRGSVNYPAVGTTVFKTGQTTGTRSSAVVATCVDALVSTPQNRSDLYGVLCATVVNATSGGQSFAAEGDSGSPIWVTSGDGARIVGLLSYGNPNFVGFSPWGQIVKDMGSLTIR